MGEAVEKEELPQRFLVRYLGSREAGGLWGIRQTRAPVDALVGAAPPPPPPQSLTVGLGGVSLPGRHFPIATISYGVQDLVYTRVFAMIVVGGETPFQCHAFACESRSTARRLTHCLAAAFQAFAAPAAAAARAPAPAPKYAVDLRTPEELHADYRLRDSEA